MADNDKIDDRAKLDWNISNWKECQAVLKTVPRCVIQPAETKGGDQKNYIRAVDRISDPVGGAESKIIGADSCSVEAVTESVPATKA